MVVPVPLFNETLNQDVSIQRNDRERNSLLVDSRQQNVEEIELAIKNIERCIASDSAFPEIADKLKIRHGLCISKTPNHELKPNTNRLNFAGIATKSGLHESEYPNSSDLFPIAYQLKSVNKVPIPNEIQEHFARMLVKSFPLSYLHAFKRFLI